MWGPVSQDLNLTQLLQVRGFGVPKNLGLMPSDCTVCFIFRCFRFSQKDIEGTSSQSSMQTFRRIDAFSRIIPEQGFYPIPSPPSPIDCISPTVCLKSHVPRLPVCHKLCALIHVSSLCPHSCTPVLCVSRGTKSFLYCKLLYLWLLWFYGYPGVR